MSGIRIQDATPVTHVKGIDKLAISDGGQEAKSISVDLLKEHINKDVNTELDERITSEEYIRPVKQ